MARKKTLKFFRGPKANLPPLLEGEPGYCTDTGELYVGTASGNNVLLNKSYPAMTQEEAAAGTSTAARTITAKVLSDSTVSAEDFNDTLNDINTALGEKANKATTLAGYGITDAAKAAKPEVLNLPLSEGIENTDSAWPSRYFKSQFGVVTLILNIKATASVPAAYVVGTLPAGYRPDKFVSVPAIATVPNWTEYILVRLNINASGSMNINMYSHLPGTFSSLAACCSFVSA